MQKTNGQKADMGHVHDKVENIQGFIKSIEKSDV